MGIDPITSSFVVQMVGIGIGGLIAIIAAFSSCFMKSRCTNISTPCMSCDRTVLEVDSIESPRRSLDTMPPTPPRITTRVRV